MPRKKRRFKAPTAVRKLARERIGTVKAGRAIEPKAARRKPKHKKPLDAGDDESVES